MILAVGPGLVCALLRKVVEPYAPGVLSAAIKIP